MHDDTQATPVVAPEPAEVTATPVETEEVVEKEMETEEGAVEVPEQA